MKKLSDITGQAEMQADAQKYALRNRKPYKCERDGCNEYVPFGRRKYCSEECGRIANRKIVSKREELINQSNPIYQLKRENLKPRVCLRCNNEFMSSSAGNRICPDCSRKNALISEKTGKFLL